MASGSPRARLDGVVDNGDVLSPAELEDTHRDVDMARVGGEGIKGRAAFKFCHESETEVSFDADVSTRLGDCRIVDQDADGPERLKGCGEDVVPLAFSGDVVAESDDRVGSELLVNLRDRLRKEGAVETSRNQLRPFFQRKVSLRPCLSTSRSCDKGNLVFETSHDVLRHDGYP